ncbi:MAG TPA: M55 family metallopeptidase, partial [bacterium]|nr:M55 family metallopeptidase [bacterium]
ACIEAKAMLGDDLPTVAVKKGISRESAILLSPEETREMLIEGAKEAVKKMPALKPYKVKFPIKLRIKRLGPEGATLENPYFSEKEVEVKNGLDIISGSV